VKLRDNGQLVIALGEAWRRTPAGGVRSGCCPVLVVADLPGAVVLDGLGV